MLAVMKFAEFPEASLLLCIGTYLILGGAYLLSVSIRAFKKNKVTNLFLQRMELSDRHYDDVFKAILKTSEEDAEWIVRFARHHKLDISVSLKYLIHFANVELAGKASLLYHKWHIKNVEEISRAIQEYGLLTISGHEYWNESDFRRWYLSKLSAEATKLRNASR